MTLIFKRQFDDDQAPRMHALVLGIGRFPYLNDAPAGDRPACADSARAMIRFLVENKDAFDAPLATIDCVISDPRNQLGDDSVPATDPTHDPRQNTRVDAGTKKHIERVCNEWLDRGRGRGQNRDVYFLYCCSHGLAGIDEQGLLVCEDYNSRQHNQPAFLLNVGSIAKSLPAAQRAGAAWIFMDACQEVLDELLDLDGGVGGIQPVRAGLRKTVSWPVKSTAIAAAKVGQFANAPAGGGIAYFTKALLHGLTHCCVESKNGAWSVTSRQVQNTLEQLAFVKHGQTITTSRLSDAEGHHRLMTLENPTIPVAITTKPESVMTTARKVTIQPRRGGAAAVLTKQDREVTWRFDLPLDERLFEVRFDYDGVNPRQQPFDLDPPSVWVSIE